jgi:hypothetical protein
LSQSLDATLTGAANVEDPGQARAEQHALTGALDHARALELIQPVGNPLGWTAGAVRELFSEDGPRTIL